ncbi:hypothetical protein [Dokdonella sp.]|uniref:hypothetical protein n=1 Tax=Dokdonella sp. TaxID=2291710 RepID=UPI003C377E7C
MPGATFGWHATLRLVGWSFCLIALISTSEALAGNPLAEWTDRLFGGRADSSRVLMAPDEGVVVLDLERPERVRIDANADQREFPKGKSRYRELELPREYANVAVRLQVISRPNPEGRGNSAFKPILYVLDDDGNVRESREVDSLQIDIRPFRPTRLLACIPMEKVRRLALATPSAAVGQYFQSKPRDKIKAPSKNGFYYETNSIKSNLPYVSTGELIVEVVPATGKDAGC